MRTIVLLVACLGAAIPRSLCAQPIRVGPATEVVRETEPRRPLEPHLAVNPRDPKHMLAATMIRTMAGAFEEQSRGQKCATFLSFDAGATWTRRDFSMTDCFDPIVAFTSDGQAIFSALAPNPPQAGNAWIHVFHSPDGGRTWAPTSTIVGGNSQDQPTAIVDRGTASKRRDWIYITSHHQIRGEDGKPRRSVQVARSRTGGKTFDEPVQIVPNNLGNLAEGPVVLSDGTLLAAFVDVAHNVVPNSGDRPLFARRRAWVVRSTDGGFTFSMPLFVNDACGPPPTFQRSAILVDTSSSPFQDRVYFLCRQVDGGPVVINASSDAGETWSAPTAVDASKTPATNRIFAATVDDRGALLVSWLDRRDKVGDPCNELYVTASLDGGRTFLPSHRVSSTPCSDSPTNELAFRQYPTSGDYFGLAATGPGQFQIVWPETRGSSSHLYTATIEVAGNVIFAKTLRPKR